MCWWSEDRVNQFRECRSQFARQEQCAGGVKTELTSSVNVEGTVCWWTEGVAQFREYRSQLFGAVLQCGGGHNVSTSRRPAALPLEGLPRLVLLRCEGRRERHRRSEGLIE